MAKITKITRDTSGAVSYETSGGAVVWFASYESVRVVNDLANVTAIVEGVPYTLPITGLLINGVAASANPVLAAKAVATTVFNTVI